MENLLGNFNDLAPLSFAQVVMAIALSLLYSFVIARVYLLVHRGYSYSKSYLHTMIMVSVTVALIMVIIGSEIARAFALVGAMSIIRFRNPVKDPRDVAFLFVTIAIGMACGVGFYMYATIFTFTIVILMLCMHYYKFGDLPNKSYVIKVVLDAGRKDGLFDVCHKFCSSVHLLSIDFLSEEFDKETIILEIELFKGDRYNQLVNMIQTQLSPEHVSLLVGESDINA
ncbi:DUF4956 domain-containing protein [Alphaproteobacteria bacterium]|nr:DUF4956 domain-containing protein [Alphaproteobacteria bacterium]